MDAPERTLLDSHSNIKIRNGKTRYTRNGRPELLQDAYNLDREAVEDTAVIFNKLDDLGMKVANNFKTNLHRGLNDPIKQRKFFKRDNQSVTGVDPNGVDVNKVLRLIAKPVSEVFALKPASKSALKTYTNKRKHFSESDGFIIESFGLPDEPIFPLHAPPVVKRNKEIDVDVRSEINDTLINPHPFESITTEVSMKKTAQLGLDSICDKHEIVDAKIPELCHSKENAQTTQTDVSKTQNIKKKRKWQVAFQGVPKRVLRSSIENNNEHTKPEFSVSSKDKNQVLNPVKLALELSEEDARLVINPFTIKQKTQARCEFQVSPEVVVKEEKDEFEVGTLAWAKIGSHPYWPCMVTNDPVLDKHWKYMTNRRHPYYHVRFFGDRGRRSWVISKNVMLFNGKHDLEKASEMLKIQNKVKWSVIKECYVIKPQNLAKWTSGVGEAESLKDKSVEERLDYFTLVVNETRRRSKKTASEEDVQNGNEHGENVPTDEETPTIKLEESVDDDDGKIVKKYNKKEEFSEESLEARKKLRMFPPASPQSEPSKKPGNSNEEERLSTSPKGRSKPPPGPAEHSNSDTDSKFSDNSSVPASLEWQAALYRRNNIFRGIPKEKVCQLCEKPGQVFKCKGACNGTYHYECGAATIKPDLDKNAADDAPQEPIKPFATANLPPNYKEMTLPEKIDYRMKEIMKKFEQKTCYSDSTDTSLDESTHETGVTATAKKQVIKHVTADDVDYMCVTSKQSKDKDAAKSTWCRWCVSSETPPCLVCNKEQSKSGDSVRQKCSLHRCGKYYHPECLRAWPQTQWSLVDSTKDTFVCPHHVCHTCISDDPHTANSRCPSDKGVKCLRCPSNYHSSSCCVPAGSEILSSSQIVCPRHFVSRRRNFQQTINTNWCFICSNGGDLICCETCPTSVHAECLSDDFDPDETYYCEDCQSGRLPLYDEIVWVKLGSFRWWPALILFPNEIPDNLRNIPHNKGEFVVKFFGTYDHYWVGRGRTFLFQEGDNSHSNKIKKRVDNKFALAIGEAAAAHQLKKQFKLNKAAKTSGLKPPPYIRIKVNKPVGNVRQFDGNTSNTTSCDCDPKQPHPCGPDSDCLNRLLLTECNPMACPAGERCNNQCFEKREYPPLVPHRTEERGWGLKTLAPIRRAQFIIEYVGEIIDEHEYQRRLQKMHQQKEENYYFLTIDKDRMIDAGPKGNVARFMNHSCQPNCETQKWTVNGDTRVGLFAKSDIPADTELTFNYNLECNGKEKKVCRCGAPTCNGYIGGKAKTEDNRKKPKKKKVVVPPPPDVATNNIPCFVCGQTGDVGACNNKICTKYYHLRCVGLTAWPDGGKWICHWHNCNVCTKRTSRCCVKCVNSYCPSHSHGYVRYDKVVGFVCSEHDPLNDFVTEIKEEVVEEIKCESKPSEEVKIEDAGTSQPENLQSETTASETKTRTKKRRRNVRKWTNKKKSNTAKSPRVSVSKRKATRPPEGAASIKQRLRLGDKNEMKI